MLKQIAQDGQDCPAMQFEIFDQNRGQLFGQGNLNFFKLTEGLKYSQRFPVLGVLQKIVIEAGSKGKQSEVVVWVLTELLNKRQEITKVVLVQCWVNSVELLLILLLSLFQHSLPVLPKNFVKVCFSGLFLKAGPDFIELVFLPHIIIARAAIILILINPMQPANLSSMTIDHPQGQSKVTNTFSSEPGNPQSNPRRAATRLKEKQLQVEMMRNRFKVIQGHDQYIKYRTLDQQRRIDHHNSVHQRLAKDKQQLKYSLAQILETSQIKQRNKELRQSIRSGLREARKSLHDHRRERSQVISQELKEYERKIQEIRKQDLEANQGRSAEVKKQEEVKRERVRQHQEYKIMNTILNKSKDSRVLSREAQHLDQEYQTMMMYEKTLLEESNRSLQASQVVRGRYDLLMTGQGSPRLPHLAKYRKATTTANSELLAQ